MRWGLTFGMLGLATTLTGMDVVNGGKAKAHIVIPKDSTDVERFAAAELVEYARKITGATLGIVVEPVEELTPLRIGTVDFDGVVLSPKVKAETDKIKHDGFVIDAGRDGGQIIAETRRGLLYGVYHVLKTDGGIYWFHPDDEELVPRSQDFVIPDQLTVRNPAFANPAMSAGIWSPPHRLIWRIRNGLSIKARDVHGLASDRSAAPDVRIPHATAGGVAVRSG